MNWMVISLFVLSSCENQKREIPEDIQQYETAKGADIRDILLQANLVKSRSEANRLLNQGAISVDGEKRASSTAPYNNESIIKVGKHRFVKIIITD